MCPPITPISPPPPPAHCWPQLQACVRTSFCGQLQCVRIGVHGCMPLEKRTCGWGFGKRVCWSFPPVARKCLVGPVFQPLARVGGCVWPHCLRVVASTSTYTGEADLELGPGERPCWLSHVSLQLKPLVRFFSRLHDLASVNGHIVCVWCSLVYITGEADLRLGLGERHCMLHFQAVAP